MVLTFTGSLSVATADRAETRAMLIGAIGCNIAWGLIDAIMYLMAQPQPSAASNADGVCTMQDGAARANMRMQ